MGVHRLGWETSYLYFSRAFWIVHIEQVALIFFQEKSTKSAIVTMGLFSRVLAGLLLLSLLLSVAAVPTKPAPACRHPIVRREWCVCTEAVCRERY
jgi:hypothetical protein